MVSVRIPTDDDEKERFAEAIRRGLGVPLEAYIGAVIGREPDQDFVEAIRLGIESHTEMSDADSPLNIKEYILEYVRWQEFSS